jgi:hypothetical protein
VIAIRQITGRRDVSRFIDYADERNRRDPHWIAPLRLSERERLSPRKNPFFDHGEAALFLAEREGRVVGRVAAIDDRLHNETHGDNLAFFGFFDADDEEVAAALLERAEAGARERGRTSVRGPVNLSMHESVGLLVDGFDFPPVLMMPHNPPEYAGYIERAGYQKVKDLYAWRYDFTSGVTPIISKMAARVAETHGITLRGLSLKDFQREIGWLRDVYCGAWSDNWGFVAPTEREFKRLATELKPIFDERAAICAEVNGRPAACLVAVPDINQALKGLGGRLFPTALYRLLLRRNKYVDQVRLLLLGILPEYRHIGIYPLLLVEFHRRMAGVYRNAEFSWVLEDNRAINRMAEHAGSRRYKTYRIYQKALW